MKVFAFVSEGQEEEKNMLENIQSIIEHAGSTGNLLMTHGFEPVTEAFGIRFYPARRKVIMDGIQYTLTRAQFHLLICWRPMKDSSYRIRRSFKSSPKRETESRRP